MSSWLKAVTQRRRVEQEMDAELEFHLEAVTADLIRAGKSPQEAARQARIALGTALTHKEGMRTSLGLRWFDELGADLRYATRMLRKSPGFTAIAAGSLALAIGANTAIFSVAKVLLYDRLQIPNAEQLKMLRWIGDDKVIAHHSWGDFDTLPDRSQTSSVFPFPIFREMSLHPAGMESLAGFKEDGMNATVRGTARRVTVAEVTGNYYDTLGVRPQLGRAIQLADETSSESGNVAVISDGLWSREFGRSPDALGQTITLNQAKLTIVGVNPAHFTGAKNVLESPDLFVPISLEPLLTVQREKSSDLVNPDFWWLNIVGRVKPGIPETEAQQGLGVQFEAVVRALATVKQGDTIPRLQLVDGSRGLHWADRMFKKPMMVLLGLTGLVLLLACANVANLLLARGAHRQREMSVRMALGAARARVARQLLTESLLLALLGGCGGLLLGYVGRNVLPRLLTNSWEDFNIRVPFDWAVFACTALIILATGILFGLAPALFAARTEVSSSLKESAQTTTRRRRGLSGKALVGLQIALSTMLVIGAGLFLRTLTALDSQDVGFNTDHLVLFDVSPPAARYPAGKDVALHQQLEARMAGLPGVAHVTPSATAYLAGSMSNSDFLPEGEKVVKNKFTAEDFNTVGNDFFPTLGINIIAGRGFNAQDTATSPKVAIINQALAKKRFPGVNPIGRMFRADRDDTQLIRIVGICSDTYYYTLRDSPPAQFFVPYVQQKEVHGMTYQMRTSLSTAALAPVLRNVVQAVDRDLPVTDLRTQREQIAATLSIERALAALTSGFGVLALSLACVGIYGIMAYSVAQRRNEIGIRLALGAQPSQVRSMVLRESTGLTVAGVAVGLAGALACTKLVRSMLYGVSPDDPTTIVVGAAVLLAVAIVATWIPARRAAGVQPMDALRHE
ncbi:ABC transporter permease [Occallatibacter savannae]|uniref:ABC transporter permease n=1 Tax=Occallatibacter savannae TaxID=1002691 RepID=UPI001EF503EE|nr:ABC transporter permease [Occallatibacter savannae]